MKKKPQKKSKRARKKEGNMMKGMKEAAEESQVEIQFVFLRSVRMLLIYNRSQLLQCSFLLFLIPFAN